MKNLPPANPRVNETWVDDDGELHVWNGSEWTLYEDRPRLPDNIYRLETFRRDTRRPDRED